MPLMPMDVVWENGTSFAVVALWSEIRKKCDYRNVGIFKWLYDPRIKSTSFEKKLKNVDFSL